VRILKVAFFIAGAAALVVGGLYFFAPHHHAKVVRLVKKTVGQTPAKYKGIKTITAEELRHEMATSMGLHVINVLSRESYEDCRIKGSLHVDLKDIEKASEAWSKDSHIVVYCANYQCNASKEAYLILEKKGFTNVAAYEGGVQEWHEKKYPTRGPCKAAFLNR